MNSKGTPIGGGLEVNNEEDVEIQRIMLASIQQQNQHGVFQSTFTAEERKRIEGYPVGLQNVGNTCYFNSLMQAYFYMPEFVQKVLEFKVPNEINPKEKNQMKFIQCIQMMFARMIKGNQKFVDPTDVLNNMTDSFGESIKLSDGQQKDIREFHY